MLDDGRSDLAEGFKPFAAMDRDELRAALADMDVPSCVALWRSVLRAQLDLVFAPQYQDTRKDRGRMERRAALAWFGTRDFRMVCDLALLEAESVMDEFRRRMAEAEARGAVPRDGTPDSDPGLPVIRPRRSAGRPRGVSQEELTRQVAHRRALLLRYARLLARQGRNLPPRRELAERLDVSMTSLCVDIRLCGLTADRYQHAGRMARAAFLQAEMQAGRLAVASAPEVFEALARRFGVAPETVRRDVAAMARARDVARWTPAPGGVRA